MAWNDNNGNLVALNVSGSATLGSSANDAVLGAQPDGTVALAVASVQTAKQGELNSQTGTTYTLVLADGQLAKNVTMSNGSANTLTIPTNESVAFAVGTVIFITQTGAGTTTVEGDTGVTLNGVSAGSGDLSAQYSGVFIQKTATDTWLMLGDHGGVS